MNLHVNTIEGVHVYHSVDIRPLPHSRELWAVTTSMSLLNWSVVEEQIYWSSEVNRGSWGSLGIWLGCFLRPTQRKPWLDQQLPLKAFSSTGLERLEMSQEKLADVTGESHRSVEEKGWIVEKWSLRDTELNFKEHLTRRWSVVTLKNF